MASFQFFVYMILEFCNWVRKISSSKTFESPGSIWLIELESCSKVLLLIERLVENDKEGRTECKISDILNSHVQWSNLKGLKSECQSISSSIMTLYCWWFGWSSNIYATFYDTVLILKLYIAILVYSDLNVEVFECQTQKEQWMCANQI